MGGSVHPADAKEERLPLEVYTDQNGQAGSAGPPPRRLTKEAISRILIRGHSKSFEANRSLEE